MKLYITADTVDLNTRAAATPQFSLKDINLMPTPMLFNMTESSCDRVNNQVND